MSSSSGGVGGVKWRQEGVNGDLAKSWKGGSGGGNPPPQPGIPEIGGWGGCDLRSSGVTL